MSPEELEGKLEAIGHNAGKSYLVDEMASNFFGPILRAIEANKFTPWKEGQDQLDANADAAEALMRFTTEVKDAANNSWEDEKIQFYTSVGSNSEWEAVFREFLKGGDSATEIMDEFFVYEENAGSKEKSKNQIGFRDSIANQPFVAYLSAMLTNAVIQDSGNRVQFFKKSVEPKHSELADLNTAVLANFGEEAGTLFLEILEGLDKQEQARLGAVPKRKKKQEVVEEKAQKVLEEVEVNLDTLDFLDEDIEDVVNLEELEDELNLDDFNLD